MVHVYGNVQSVRPLGLLANGNLYLIAIPPNHNRIAGRLAHDYGHWVSLQGWVAQNDGASVFEVTRVQ